MSDNPESVPATPATPRLLDQVRLRLRLKHYSLRTETSYTDWIRRFILFHHKRHPRDMGEREVTAFLTHLAADRQVSASTQNQALAALLFLYREVLDTDLPWLTAVVRAKRPLRLPTVLSLEEVEALLSRVSGKAGLVAGLVARLLYGTGMRVMEGVRLRVKDVDFLRGEITVRDGKARAATTVSPCCRGGWGSRCRRSCGSAACCSMRIWRPVMPTSGCRMRSPSSIPTRRASGVGNTCLRPRGYRWTRAATRSAAIIWTRSSCNAMCCGRPLRRASSSRYRRTRCGIALPRTCWNRAMTSARCRRCWGTGM